MEKDRFNYLVNHYNSLSQQETAELRMEQDRFGYCQVLHQLIARGDQDNQTEMKDQSLTVAAVYSTDRAVLKKIMTEPRMQRVEWTPSPVVEDVAPAPEPVIEFARPTQVEEAAVSIQKEDPKIVYATPPSVSDFDQEAAVSRFMAELAPMREKKLQFEKAIEEFEKNLSKPAEKPKRKTKATETANTSEQILQEIKTTKKKVAVDSPKQKEQTEIIDQFIKTKPTIPKAIGTKPTSAPPEVDLTELTETYNENVVSETLALILIRQGKKEKAVEVLRKLIWKFPQKKAYFAAQIEDLTK